jgi:hypothetical protein
MTSRSLFGNGIPTQPAPVLGSCVSIACVCHLLRLAHELALLDCWLHGQGGSKRRTSRWTASRRKHWDLQPAWRLYLDCFYLKDCDHDNRLKRHTTPGLLNELRRCHKNTKLRSRRIPVKLISKRVLSHDWRVGNDGRGNGRPYFTRWDHRWGTAGSGC